ncbi:hypothetical protein QF035_002287 [Streptomyces umbrinus]|uniref:Uncharacterized protein n=1 Tax=Streptomyces umbrinus TaxID=67370 RepID=A0ABU0SMC6_9ACTN|nr:hypothetical protein [Streptomyces umbrinus]
MVVIQDTCEARVAPGSGRRREPHRPVVHGGLYTSAGAAGVGQSRGWDQGARSAYSRPARNTTDRPASAAAGKHRTDARAPCGTRSRSTYRSPRGDERGGYAYLNSAVDGLATATAAAPTPKPCQTKRPPTPSGCRPSRRRGGLVDLSNLPLDPPRVLVQSRVTPSSTVTFDGSARSIARRSPGTSSARTAVGGCRRGHRCPAAAPEAGDHLDDDVGARLVMARPWSAVRGCRRGRSSAPFRIPRQVR